MATPRLLTRAATRISTRAGPSRILSRHESTSAAPAPAAFEPALPAGAEPAYDAALAYIAEENKLQRERLAKLQAKAGAKPTPEQVRRIARLEVDAYVNDPAIRRTFKTTGGKGLFAQPVFRNLAERKWKKEGELDLIMQRVYQLGVIPDLLADHLPAAAIRIAGIEAGSIQSSEQFATPPEVTVQLFNHPVAGVTGSATPEAKYTLLVIDADAPSHETHSFVERLHFAKTDIPLSVVSDEVNLFTAAGKEVLAYEPFAPARGTGKHRYAFIVIKQGDAAPSAEIKRDGFNIRTFFAANGLATSDVIAATLIRSQWTEEAADHIGKTYQEFRGQSAPEYGKPPKEAKYGMPLNARQQRAAEVRQEAYEGVIAEMQALVGGQLGEAQAKPQEA
ncbi:54S ribosomal protein L35, mitochondrial [Vanrija pseudolonga]|uniref:54S ribosomal protein L35, mitochondrial n=1 Tax=Vanrija pseudolonga TaxID=143232 RepID=A0AAF0Y8Y8_9TREE|nr:54S ribosomal protein L35, mitochondrial [Vanrija pseudolonga]